MILLRSWTRYAKQRNGIQCTSGLAHTTYTGFIYCDSSSGCIIAPETEPMIKCELLYSKAMEESGKEVTKEVDWETRMADRYDVNMWFDETKPEPSLIR